MAWQEWKGIFNHVQVARMLCLVDIDTDFDIDFLLILIMRVCLFCVFASTFAVVQFRKHLRIETATICGAIFTIVCVRNIYHSKVG